MAISPDGSQLAYVANYQLYLKSMSEMSSQAIQGGEVWMATMNPVFSPDSRSLAFYSSADKALKRMAVTGGGAVTIAAIGAPFGLSWPTDDVILIGQGARGIVRVPASGGTPETIVAVADGELAQGPMCRRQRGRRCLGTGEDRCSISDIG